MRGHHGGTGNGVVLNYLQHTFWAELFQHIHGPPTREPAQCTQWPCVIHRAHHEVRPNVGWFAIVVYMLTHTAREQLRVHDAFGKTCSARGVQHIGRRRDRQVGLNSIEGVHPWQKRLRAIVASNAVDSEYMSNAHLTCSSNHIGARALVAKHGTHVGIVQDVCHFFCGEVKTRSNYLHTRKPRHQVHHSSGRSIARNYCNTLTRSQPQRRQRLHGLLAYIGKFTPRIAGVSVGQRHFCWFVVRLLAQNVSHFASPAAIRFSNHAWK